MKKTVKSEATFCDFCRNETPYNYHCDRCKKDMCMDCWNLKGINYSHRLYVSGSGDGHYCKECNAVLLMDGTDKRHSSLVAISSLRKELEEWSAAFEVRQKKAEALVEKYQPKD